MSETDLYLLKTYGPYFVIVFLMLRELWSFLRDKVFPLFAAKMQQKDEMAITLEERQVRAFEEIAKNTQQLTVLFATINERTMRIDAGVSALQMTVTAHDARSQERNRRSTDGIETKPLPRKRGAKAEA